MPTEDAAPARAASPTRRWLRALELTAGFETDGGRTLPEVIDASALERGNAPALLSDRECFSYAELAARSNRYSRWALSLALEPGRSIGILMENRPDYLAAWIGITRVGHTAALLNTNLGGAALAHCIAAAEAGHLVVSSEYAKACLGAVSRLPAPPRVWLQGDAGEDGLETVLGCFPSTPLDEAERRPVGLSTRALLIFTSGTTGLPKAANVSHRRIMTWSAWFAGLAGTGPADRIYDALPVYHSVGGVVAPGSVLVTGGSVVIAERFSTSRFWSDIAAWDCTLAQYIGELCRFLLGSAAGAGPPPRHRLRLMLGNGLRPDIWTAFQERFAIPEILEFYAATEGSFSLVNVEGKVGALGRIPPFLAHRFPAALVEFDVESGLPRRGPDGRCRRVATGDVGEAIGRVGGTSGATGRFEGYTDRAGSDAKILEDVFVDGDRWFRTGDLMRQDAAGFYYFVDRIGDTFRWKGENVSTAEVAEVVMAAPGVRDATVFGVTVPGHDGRAGMAALVVGEGFALPAFRRHLDLHLPAYARPRFLRLLSAIDTTTTFKPIKAPLVRQGFDPAEIEDPLFVEDPDAASYAALDDTLHARILAGAWRL